MPSTTGNSLEGTALKRRLESMFEGTALPLFATTDPAQALLLDGVLRMLRNTQARDGRADRWSAGPFGGSLTNYVKFQSIDDTLGVRYRVDGCGNANCPFCPAGRTPIFGALFEVGVAPPTAYVLAPQRTWAVRLLIDFRPDQAPATWYSSVQIGPEYITQLLWQPTAEVYSALEADLDSTPPRNFLTRDGTGYLIAKLAEDTPRLLDHLRGPVAPPRSDPADDGILPRGDAAKVY